MDVVESHLLLAQAVLVEPRALGEGAGPGLVGVEPLFQGQGVVRTELGDHGHHPGLLLGLFHGSPKQAMEVGGGLPAVHLQLLRKVEPIFGERLQREQDALFPTLLEEPRGSVADGIQWLDVATRDLAQGDTAATFRAVAGHAEGDLDRRLRLESRDEVGGAGRVPDGLLGFLLLGVLVRPPGLLHLLHLPQRCAEGGVHREAHILPSDAAGFPIAEGEDETPLVLLVHQLADAELQRVRDEVRHGLAGLGSEIPGTVQVGKGQILAGQRRLDAGLRDELAGSLDELVVVLAQEVQVLGPEQICDLLRHLDDDRLELVLHALQELLGHGGRISLHAGFHRVQGLPNLR
ncbi:MAG: hypothetical protein COU51_01640 [Parcubacteria group bacterium CG10_big_fil_rev_8_21_14_0_10_36_14]|nr:MAG: hypothetical protein COU51_01640 [Parcubacteria group bacterium CG10_big_fil_rev_8_21_14_0_10_36_14]